VLQRADQGQLLLRRDPRVDVDVAGGRTERLVVEAGSSRPDSTRPARRPICSATACAVRGWSPGDHDHADSGVLNGRHGLNR
jgi:hypothetical protein